MNVSDAMEKMIRISKGNTHDIAHFMKVYTLARTIGIEEHLDPETQEKLEITAIIHDISCPLCREKYGNTNGRYQELESPPLVREFLKEFDLPEETKERIVWVISHHHTYSDVSGIDYQILIEADFLVNAGESSYSRQAIESARRRFFRTKTGIRLLDEIYLSPLK